MALAAFLRAHSAVQAPGLPCYIPPMPRANRYTLTGRVCHITHRCHDQAFLLRFARDRDAYRARLREALKTFDVHLLSYAVTLNHVHLLTLSDDLSALSQMMQTVAGQSAQAYNQRKGRSGAFWSDRYHATMVQTGGHLWACLRYIDLNMVRAGAVSHPADWEWTGWHELMGLRQRYRLLDLEALISCLEEPTVAAFRTRYGAMTEDALQRRELGRQPCWTESVAVGSEEFVKEAEGLLRAQGLRLKTIVEETGDGTWVLREPEPPYG
jgi:putative transposase